MHPAMQQETPAYRKTRALYEKTYPDKKIGVYTEEDWLRLRTAESFGLGKSVLDIGPGNGALLQILAASGAFDRIHGVDINRHSQLLLPEGVDYQLRSIAALEFPDRDFDTVFCMEVLEHLEDADLDKGLANLRRISKKRLVMTVPYNEPHPLWWHDRPGGHRQQFDAERLVSMFPNARACFQKRAAVDWIFLIEGDSPKHLPLVSDLLASDLPSSAVKAAVSKAPQPSVPPNPAPASQPAEAPSSSTSVDKNHDRILDVYYRRHGSDEMQEQARDRIHWILSEVTTSPVLDIGCSQGLVPILLGRSGFRVLGIDLLDESIAQARGALADDPQSVQELVEFRVADASGLQPEEPFKTVILGEIIEHHASPGKLLKSIRQSMEPGGKLILTTPFAYHPDPDHKQTFFLSNLADLLSIDFESIDLFVKHDFICCTAIASSAASTSKPKLTDRVLLERSEEAFLSLQLHLRKQLKDVRYMYTQGKAREGKIESARESLSALRVLLESLRDDLGKDFESAFFDPSRIRPSIGDSVRSFLKAPSKPSVQAAEPVQYLFGRLAQRVRFLLAQNSQLETENTLLRDERDTLKESEQQSEARLRAYKATLAFRRREKRSPLAGLVDSLAVLTGAGSSSRDNSDNRPSSPPKKSSQVADAGGSDSETSKWIRRVERPGLQLPVACIMDEFSWENFRDEADLYQITKENWKDELIAKPPEFLFVESAWAGNGGNWQYKITYKEPRDDNPLFALLAYCKENKIPTVFWNKEDPPNYDHFLDAARRFDFIFTTDEGCVAKYEKAAPDSTIAVLSFAAQPSLQNPVNRGRMPILGDICFAGAWYARHPERFEDLQNLLQASAEYNLDIYDRYLNHPQHDRYKFPDEYEPYIKGSLGFREMTEKYRNYKVFLNVNSVKDSPSMFSRRVLEILACGTPVVSGYARGIEEMLGSDIVPLVRTAEEAKKQIDLLMDSEIERDKLVLRGQRKIFSEHTYRHRFRTICDALGLCTTEKPLKVSVVTATIRTNFVDNFLQNFLRQTYENKELIVVINEGRELTREFIEERARELGVTNYRVLVVPDSTTLGTCLNLGVAESSGELFAKMDDDDYYGASYLHDSVLALQVSGADCVGKESYYTYIEGRDQLFLRGPGVQHRECKFVIGTTLVGYRSLFPEVSFGNTRVGEDTIFLRRLVDAGKKLYSHSQYNYIKYYARDLSHHTWNIDEQSYLKRATPVCDGFATDLVCF